MHIVHLPSSYFPDTVGGTEVYVRQLVESLREQGHSSEVAWHTATDGLPQGCRALPPLHERSRIALYRKMRGDVLGDFAAYLQGSGCDVVHFHAFTLGASLDHARVAKRLGIPYVITFHTPTMACPRGTWLLEGKHACDGLLEPRRCSACALMARGWPQPIASALARSTLPARAPEGPWTPVLSLPSLLSQAFSAWQEFFANASSVVACAQFVAERLVRNGVAAERITVLRQALPGAPRTRVLRLPALRPGRPLKLGLFGRITAIKGPDLLIDAARILRSLGLETEVELAGPIAQADAAWAQRIMQGQRWVRHKGTLQGSALQDWLRSLDLVVLPSRWFETGPLTLLEAWDAGVMALGTDLGGIAEFMRSQALETCLFELERPDSIAAAVERILAWSGPEPQVTIPSMDELGRTMTRIYENCRPATPSSLGTLTGA